MDAQELIDNVGKKKFMSEREIRDVEEMVHRQIQEDERRFLNGD